MSTWAFSIAGVLQPLQTGWQMQLTASGRNRFVGKVYSKDASYRPGLDDSIGIYERIPIATIAAGNPTVITTAETHGLVSGQMVNVGAVVGNVPATINSTMRATVSSPTQFTVPLATTTAGRGGVAERALFGGYVITPRERGQSDEPMRAIYTEITAVSFDQMTERRYAKEVLVSGTLKSMLTTLVAHYMPGVVVNATQVDGPVLPAVPCDYAQVRNVLDTIAGLAGGYVWEVDPHLQARMFLPASEQAPFDVIEGDRHAIGDVTSEPTRTDYANRVIVQFTAAAVPAYAFCQADQNFADGETVQVGSKTYTYQAALTDADGHLAIGADPLTSINTLLAAINLSGGNYAASMTKHSQVFASRGPGNQAVIQVTAVNAGASGNSIGVATTAAHARWYGEGSVPLTSLALGADAALTNTAMAEDATEQAAHQIWETIVQAADVTDYNLALATAQAVLALKRLVPRTVTYRTKERGALPGQRQTISMPSRNLNGTFLITDVNGGNPSENVVEWTVTAIESLTPGSAPQWRDTYKQWSGSVGGGGGTAVNVAGGGSGGGGGAAPRQPVYFLGGAPTIYVQSPTPDWVPADGSRPGDSGTEYVIDTVLRQTTTATARVRVRAAAGSVTARVYDLDAGRAVGTSNPYTGTAFGTLVFPVLLTAGAHRYQLQLLPSVANSDVNGVGYLE
jgi:hypothetical protein